MNLLITGLPGVGKGTQSDLLVEKYNVVHLSTGNLFRNEITNKTKLGLELKKYIDLGELVPDELTIKILKEEINQPKYKSGFLLDGFPRTIDQAKALDQMLQEDDNKIDCVIALELDESEIIKRLSGRLMCPSCQATYHIENKKPKEIGKCDVCNEDLIQRDDDKFESITNRLKIANEQTMPVIDYYKKQNIVSKIKLENNGTIEEEFKKIVKVLG